MKKALLIIPGQGDEYQKYFDILREKNPDIEVDVLDNPLDSSDGKTGIANFIKRLDSVRSKSYDLTILPFKGTFLKISQYLKWFIVFFFCGIGSRFVVDADGVLSPPLRKVFDVLVLQRFDSNLNYWLGPLISLCIILTLPFYVFKQVLLKFILTREDPSDEFTGFGKGKAVNGIIYWLMYVKKARKYGLFGFCREHFMGMPLSVHSWPVAIWFLDKLGYRRFVYFSVFILFLAFFWLAVAVNKLWLVPLIPLIFFSNYYIFNIYTGTWEMLSWGFSAMTFASFYNNNPYLAGVFLGATLLSHPGAGFLTFLMVFLFFLFKSAFITKMILMCIVSFVLSIWFVVPYWFSRKKLGRDKMINAEWNYVYKWTSPTIYQLIAYIVFLLSAFYFNGFDNNCAYVILPLVVLYYNVKIRWQFSAYTVYMFMLLVGGIYCFLNPNIIPFLIYLLMIYSSSDILIGMSKRSGIRHVFDLTPVTLGENRTKIRAVFNSLEAGRISLELPDRGNAQGFIGWNYMPAFGYILEDEKNDLLTCGYTEIGDFNIYEKYCRYINSSHTIEEQKKAIIGCGIKYIAAYTQDYIKFLEDSGFEKISEIKDICLSFTHYDDSVNFVLFKVPWEVDLLEPKTDYEFNRNKIIIKAEKGREYIIKYSYFKGWRAYQAGKRLKIRDEMPGMMVKAEIDGELVLKYSYLNYWG